MTPYNQLTIAIFEIRNRKTLHRKKMYAKVTSKSGTAPTAYLKVGSGIDYLFLEIIRSYVDKFNVFLLC